MSVLRVYLPAECDSSGVPLDWERCRSCGGSGCPAEILTPGRHPSDPAFEVREFDSCLDCNSCGSLREAALTEKIGAADRRDWDRSPAADVVSSSPIRCEDCGHPMSEGTWEGEYGDEISYAEVLAGDEPLRRHLERNGTVHFSPCDEGCRHHPLTDCRALGLVPYSEWSWHNGASTWPREASWRPVDVRCLSWPHDLRPGQLAVLCLRCWATRNNPGAPA